MHTIATTPMFNSAAEDLGVSEDERHEIETLLSKNPMHGELIRGTGGARKFRFAKNNGGKRSGYRIITYYACDDVPVFLLDMYDKKTEINLSASEKKALKQILSTIVEDYRESTRERVSELHERKAS